MGGVANTELVEVEIAASIAPGEWNEEREEQKREEKGARAAQATQGAVGAQGADECKLLSAYKEQKGQKEQKEQQQAGVGAARRIRSGTRSSSENRTEFRRMGWDSSRRG